MFGLLPLLLVAVVVLSMVALVGLAQAPRASAGPDAQPWLRRSRLRSWTALGGAVLVGGSLLLVGSARPDLLGLPYALAPGAAAIAGLLAHAAVPAVRPAHDGPRAASLSPRRPWSYGTRWTFVVPSALAVLTVAVLLVTGATSSPDERGRYREVSLTDGPFTASHGPYPGWWYAVPLLVVTVLLAGSIWLALIRIARQPAPPVAGLHEVDVVLRGSATRVIARLGSAALLAYLGGVLSFAGMGITGVSRGWVANGGLDHPGLWAVGLVASIGGVVALVAGAAVAGTAALTALRLPVRLLDGAPRVLA